MKIFTSQNQKQLLTVKGLNRLSNVDLAAIMHVSRPTIHKMLNDKTPLIIQDSLYKRFDEFMAAHRVIAGQDK